MTRVRLLWRNADIYEPGSLSFLYTQWRENFLGCVTHLTLKQPAEVGQMNHTFKEPFCIHRPYKRLV